MFKNFLSFLKSALAPGFDKAKAEILHAIAGAQADLQTGRPAARVVTWLQSEIEGIVGRAKLPGAAKVLITLALSSVNWNVLATSPASTVKPALEKLRERIAGARL
jgi:hypothetical protein